MGTSTIPFTVSIVARDPETGLPHRFDVPGEKTDTRTTKEM